MNFLKAVSAGASLALAVCAAGGAHAQPGPAQPTIEDLRDMLAERDAIIADLTRRIEALEQRADVRPAAPISQYAPQADKPAAVAVSQRTAAPEPGALAPDEESIERALERALVQTGALLLPAGSLEIAPQVGYARRADQTPSLFVDNGSTFIAEIERRRDEITAALGLRIGLPFDSQLEASFPYNYAHQSFVTEAGFTPRSETTADGSGVGDIHVALAHTFFRERGWRPDIVGRVRWDTGSGESSDGGVALDGGFGAVGGSLTLIKRQDPLVFFAGVGFDDTFEHGGVEPGDAITASLDAFLAASPETTLRFGFSQQFVREFRIDGAKIAGSDRRGGLLIIGGSTILARGVLLDIAGGVGLTEDSPDYTLMLSLPVRF